MEINGGCSDKLSKVKDAFALNFIDSDPEFEQDCGACVAAMVDGELLVDLWGGHTSEAKTELWKEDTIVCVFSVTKAVAAVCMHVLHDRGIIPLDAPIAEFWPAFAENGKEDITVRLVLSHQAGLLYVDNVPDGSIWQDGVYARALEVAAPEWSPGTDAGYHAFSFGPILQELVHRVTGRSLGQVLNEEIATPFDIDFGIGLTEEQNARCATYIGNDRNGTIRGFRFEKDSPVYRAWKALPRNENFNSEDWRRKELASLNGHGNARALARLFSCYSEKGLLSGRRLLSKSTVEDVSREHWSGTDRFAKCPGRFNAGCQLMTPEHSPFGGGESHFGFYGIGGSVTFCDPVNRIVFSYCCNKALTGASGTSKRSVRLIKALYNSLGKNAQV